MGTTLAFLGILGFFVGLVLLVIGLIRKKKMKGGLVLGISIVVFIIGFIMVPTNGIESSKDSKDKEKVETAAKSKEETREEKAAREAKEAEDKEQKANEEAEAKEKSIEDEIATDVVITNWQTEIANIVGNSDRASDKFYALEKFLMEYKATPEEVDQFSKEIVNDYKSGTYLSEIENHERMLTNILKSYYVEKNSSGALKDFAFDYFQNMKYVYRGADTVDSEAVKSNERQMNKSLSKM
ncbi:cell envelope integrity protein TolA [Lysinibacillus sp. JNUCC 51]|uniref:cell envelope integrity protein TolA n=1 Tax=Lysinibacillus sp. JNUCC-51 TaxID=2792479 RepID=UPI0019377A46|nr:cell envelope integrity protein TolA [Lysinibacillus sp. JNUCC-51]